MTEPPAPALRTALFRFPGPLLRALEAAAIAALLLTVVFARFHEPTRFMATLQKLAHPVTFGAVALLFFSLLRGVTTSLRFRYLAAFGLAVAGGAATEIAQGFVHRDPEVFDVLRDAWGAATALAALAAFGPWAALRGRGRWRALGAVGALLGLGVMLYPLSVCLAAYARRDLAFPVLAEACSPIDRYFLRGVAAQLSTVPAATPLAGPCGRALRVDLLPAMYPGLHLIEPYPDWTHASALVLQLRNPDATDLWLGLRVHDRAHNQEYRDRFNREFVVKAGERLEIAIPVRDIERAPANRRLDLRQVAGLMLFRVRGSGAGSFELEEIALRP